jgi:mRNA interferase MazF
LADPEDLPESLAVHVRTDAQRLETRDAGAQSGEAPAVVPHRGGVYWVEVDAATGVTPNYRHPHVVIQDDVLNQSRIHTVVVCAISSNLTRATEPGNVRLDPGEGNLSKPSVVIVSQISSIPKTQLGALLGTLSEQRVEQILSGLCFQQRAHFQGR